MPNPRLKRRHELPPLTGIDYLGDSAGNLRWKSFRMRSGWTGKERDTYRPGLHRCPACGARIRQGDGNYVTCKDCDWRSEGGDVDWNSYEPPSTE